jgi:hypothetical protein
MKFIKLRNGSSIRADTITAVRVADGRFESPSECELYPRVIVDFVFADRANSIILNCATNEERDTLAASIMAEIKSEIVEKTP